ncbi:hypothetical protein ACWDWO_28235 [Actinopolymorpha singaporensis]|uniref:Uncharacterized protein n=1 Tax=Actinopolymorpha singaporensis TaxID=117157 RepID=A0A1H1LPH9_9ACTN|nr:hypothetical protein [Actinopolymorpha singaporensis]SDR76220.1 hypothetical protein SAMN04489717_0445 [Actinopolymorpha singaporensis]
MTLPRGYDFARWYEHEVSSDDDGSESLDEATAAPAASWSVYFFPTDGPREDGLPVVIVCVQRPGIKDVLCPEQNDATHLHRQVGQNHVAISRVSPGRQDMTAWHDLELTTDLNKVTWLR